MIQKLKDNSISIGKLLLLFSWIPFIGLAAYAQPFLDDYWNGSICRDMGFARAFAFQFNNWSGRFFTNAVLIVLNPLSYGWLTGIKLVGPLSTLLKLACLLWALRVLTNRQLSLKNSAWIAAGLLLVYYAVVPDKYASIYSFTYWAVYQLPCLLLLLVPLAILEYHRNTLATRRWAYLALATVGTVCAAASNEMTLALLGWLLALGAGLSVYRRQWASLAVWLSLGVVLIVAGFVAVVLAPGNHARMLTEFTANVSYSPLVLLPRVARSVKYLLTDTQMLAIIALPLLMYSLGQHLVAFRPRALELPFAVGAMGIAVGVVLGGLPYNIVNYPALERPVNVLYWWLLLGWLFVCWASLPTQAQASATRFPQSLRIVTGLAVALTMLSPIVRAWTELLVDGPHYSQQYNARYLSIAEAVQNGQKLLTVRPIEGVTPRYILIRNEVGPQSLYDVKAKASSPNNVRVAQWFKLDSVRMQAAQ